jgi:OOP family OmpA-OmpF porin
LNASFLTALFLIVAAAPCHSETIRETNYAYGYGDTVKAMESDAFVVCSNCAPDKLDKLPKQYVAIRVTEPTVPRPILQPHEKPMAPAQPEKKPESACGPECHVGDILFGFDRDVIGKSEKLKLNKIMATLPPNASVSLAGYTCTIGTKEYNQHLSEKRAHTVAHYMRTKGVHVESAIGKGECCQVSENKKKNRRVEITEKKGSE